MILFNSYLKSACKTQTHHRYMLQEGQSVTCLTAACNRSHMGLTKALVAAGGKKLLDLSGQVSIPQVLVDLNLKVGLDFE